MTVAQVSEQAASVPSAVHRNGLHHTRRGRCGDAKAVPDSTHGPNTTQDIIMGKRLAKGRRKLTDVCRYKAGSANSEDSESLPTRHDQ